MTRLALLSLSLLAFGACHKTDPGVGREPDEYVGCATDENWATFDDVPDVVSDTQAPAITAPSAGSTLAATPVDFTWKQSATVDGTTAGDVPQSCEQWTPGYTTLHLPPISGTAYDLQVIVGGEVKHRVITTLQKWTASPGVWASFRGQTVTLKLRRLVLLNNDRKEGPYVATSPFTVTVSN